MSVETLVAIMFGVGILAGIIATIGAFVKLLMRRGADKQKRDPR